MDSSTTSFRVHILFLALLFCLGGPAGAEAQVVDRGKWVVRKEFLPHSNDNNRKVELFWTKPGEDGPYPAVLLIHGHQEQIRNGGEAFVKTGRLGILAKSGLCRRFSFSARLWQFRRPADYCGPITQDAVLVAMRFSSQAAFR